MDFFYLDLNDNALDALDDMNFTTCTPVQEKCIPEILNGRDVLGVAQTGTGKTAAYLLPILSLLDDGGYPKDKINCIIMSPTRELAQQIDQAMQGFAYYMPEVSSVAVYGGNDGNRYDQEYQAMKMGADVIIATPMFSATMPQKIEQLANTLLKNPVTIKLAVSKPAEKIHQMAYVCHENQKMGIMRHLFKEREMKRVIVFSSSKLKVKDLYHDLLRMKVSCGEMHSDLTQAERDEVMYKFKSGQIDVLVATDIVARGIDIDDIAMVINYDVPHDAEDYVHRIGRTARADRDGEAITLVRGYEIGDFMEIEKFLEKDVEKLPLPKELGEGPEYKPMRRNGNRQRGRGGKGHGNRGRKGHNPNSGKADKRARRHKKGNKSSRNNSRIENMK